MTFIVSRRVLKIKNPALMNSAKSIQKRHSGRCFTEIAARGDAITAKILGRNEDLTPKLEAENRRLLN